MYFLWHGYAKVFRHLYFLGMHTRLKACVYEEHTSDLWDILRYTTRKHCVTSIYHLNTTIYDNPLHENGIIKCTVIGKKVVLVDGERFWMTPSYVKFFRGLFTCCVVFQVHRKVLLVEGYKEPGNKKHCRRELVWSRWPNNGPDLSFFFACLWVLPAKSK